MQSDILYSNIVRKLQHYASISSYTSDADEKDPRYKSHGVRMKQVREIIGWLKPNLTDLPSKERLHLVEKLIFSENGEEQTIGISILSKNISYFTSPHLPLLHTYIQHLYGWSKIDTFILSFVQKLLLIYPDEVLGYVKKWNRSSNSWERRASVVTFTRNVGESGKYTDLVISLCEHLIFDKEDMVQKAVGWALKDNLKGNRKMIVEYIRSLRKRNVSSVITLYAMKDLDQNTRKELLLIR